MVRGDGNKINTEQKLQLEIAEPMAFPASGLAAPGSAVLATLVGSSVWTVYLMPPESGSCQTEAAESSASKLASPKP